MTPEQQAAFIIGQSAMAMLDLAEVKATFYNDPKALSIKLTELRRNYEGTLGYNPILSIFQER